MSFAWRCHWIQPNLASRRIRLDLQGSYRYDRRGDEYRRFYWWGHTWYGRFINGVTPWYRTGRNLIQEQLECMLRGQQPGMFLAEYNIRGVIIDPYHTRFRREDR